MEERAFPGVEGTFVHPFDDHNFIAGNATLGLEILEDLPTRADGHRRDRRRRTDLRHRQRASGRSRRTSSILGAEPETAAPGALSFEKGSPQAFEEWEASFVDGAGGKSIFPRMWERMQGIVDGSIVVTLDETKRAMRLVAEKMRVIAEGAGALAVAAALTGKAGEGPIVAVVSGGNIDLKKFCEILESAGP